MTTKKTIFVYGENHRLWHNNRYFFIKCVISKSRGQQMSKNIELHIFGQVLRLNCPEEQQDALRAAASQLEERVGELKERTGILQLDRILSIVALNLTFELQQEKQKSSQQDTLMTRIQQLDTSLSNALAEIGSDMQILGR